MYHCITKHACFFVLKHRERSTPGLFPFLEELTPAGRALYPGLCPAERQGSSLFPAPLHRLCQRPGPRPFPASPGQAGPREERVGKSSHSHAMAPPAARIPGTARAARPRGLPGLAVPAPARGLLRTALTPPPPSPAGAGTRGVIQNSPHAAFSQPGWCRDPRSERRRAGMRQCRPGPIQRWQQQRSPHSSGCADLCPALHNNPWLPQVCLGFIPRVLYQFTGNSFTWDIPFFTRTASPKVQTPPQCCRCGAVPSSGLLSTRKTRSYWRGCSGGYKDDLASGASLL